MIFYGCHFATWGAEGIICDFYLMRQWQIVPVVVCTEVAKVWASVEASLVAIFIWQWFFYGCFIEILGGDSTFRGLYMVSTIVSGVWLRLVLDSSIGLLVWKGHLKYSMQNWLPHLPVKQCLTQFEQEKKGHPVRMLGAPSRERQSNDWSTLALGIKTLAPREPKPAQNAPFIVPGSLSWCSLSLSGSYRWVRQSQVK